MANFGAYNEDGSLRVSVVGGSAGGSTVTQGAAGTDPWPVSARQSGAWTVALGAGAAAIGKVEVSNLPATQPVSGTFWQTTQPVSLASQPLPNGAATAAKQPALGTAGTPATDVLTIQGVAAGTPIPTIPVGSTPLGYVQTAAGDLATAIALPSVPAGTTVATIIPDGAGVRHRKDGTAPTASSGMPIPVGGAVKLYGAEIAAARFIQQSAGAILNIEYAK